MEKSDDSRRSARAVPSVRHAREARAAWWAGLAASLVVHVLIFVLWRGQIPFPIEQVEGARAATPVGGGGALQAMHASLPAVREIPPPARPVLAIETPDVEIRDVEVSLPGPDLAPAGPIGNLPGIGGGSGEGDGGDGSGEEDYVSPMPRSILPHWDPPNSVRGMEVTVRIHVDASGRPTGEVVLDPPTPDRGFNREIEERVRRMEYRPASRNGQPVDGWAEITFIF
ncbi:MAG: TonB family protein [Gemmatimonadota bacterium]|nr:TonB family protein [Gemmatimonadota bacterium]